MTLSHLKCENDISISKLKGFLTKMPRWLRIIVLLVLLHHRSFYVQGSDCVGLKCENGGTVIFDSSSGECYCKCPSNVTGLLCEYHIRESSFPPGPFALPMSKDGCPEGPSQGWGLGNINITTRMSLYEPNSFPDVCRPFVHDIQDRLKSNNPAFRTDILGPFNQYTLQMNFCFKFSGSMSANGSTWPQGTYGVYGTDDGCPEGFSQHVFSICFPPLLHYQTDGHLPYFDIKENTDGSEELKFIYCRHQDNGQKLNNLDVFSPYMIIKDPVIETYGCPETTGYETIDEYFPIPMPTTMEGFNTTYPGNQYEHFQFSYCRSIPNQFTWSDKYSAIDYSILLDEAGFPGTAYPFIDITTEHYGCNRIGLPLSVCGIQQTWLMIDIRKSILVSMVGFGRKERFSVVFSRVFVADQRWSFLNDGALLCKHNGKSISTTTHIFRCYKPQYGRFVTFLGDRNNDWDFSDTTILVLMYNATEVHDLGKKFKNEYLKGVSDEIASAISYIDTESKSCKQELGMQDFGIRDGQLNASTWQPQNLPSQARIQYSGWCAGSLDKKPFIQVDLVFITWIDGIVLINWGELVETYHDNVYGRTVVARGSAFVHLQFGSDTENLQGTRELTYDTSRILGEPQTFIFTDPFIARYLRMYPRAFPGTKFACMKFEILGCRNSDSIKLKCGEESQRQISRANTIFIPHNKMPITHPNLAHSECEALCLHKSAACVSMIYKENGSCFLYTEDAAYNYVTRTSQEKGDVMAMAYCLQEDRADYFKLDDSWKLYKESNITKPGFLTNIGYPFTYTYNSVYRWKIDFPETFVILQFMDISLRLFNDNQKIFLNNVVCRDTIFINRISKLDQNDIRNPFQHFVEPNIREHYTLNSEYNGRTPVFSMASVAIDDSNYISFYSCSYGSLLEAGRGFRVHVSGTAPSQVDNNQMCNTPFMITSLHNIIIVVKRSSETTISGLTSQLQLKQAWKDNGILKDTKQAYCLSDKQQSYCLLPEMELISPRFLGRYDDLNVPKGYDWTIMACFRMMGEELVGYTSLISSIELKEFDMSCHSESKFKISDDEFRNENVYCNGNRPFGKRTVITGWTEVTYTPSKLQPAVDTVFPEGFSLAFRCIPKHEMWSNVVPVSLGVIGGFENTEVCVTEQRKCFTIHTVTSTSWNDVAKMCHNSNATIVSIKTKEEMFLIRAVLIEYYKGEQQIYRYYLASKLFIGLRRYVDSSGTLHEHWADGTPLTFTAWDSGEPSDTLLNQCTYMGFHQPDNNNTWRTVPCNDKSDAEYSMTAICEYKTTVLETTDFMAELYDLKSDLFNPKNLTTMHKCASGEWILSRAKCNGVAECLDSSDELSCESHDVGSCTKEEFKCTNGRCIHVSQVCDFVEDCLDASDELCEFPSCGDGEFVCANKQCISSEERCDSIQHCSDGSDEQNCDECNLSRSFRCGDKSCISKRLVCDMHTDCSDGLDEMSCDHDYKTCDELWRDGYKTNGYFRSGQAYYIYCNFDNLKEGWGVVEMTYPNTDWKQLSKNDFRIETAGINNAFYKGYECTQKFSVVPHRERLQVLYLDNKTVYTSEQELPLDWVPNVAKNSQLQVSNTLDDDTGQFHSFTVSTLEDFDTFQNGIKIWGVNCRKFISKTERLEEPALFCRHGVRSINESQRCLYGKDGNGIIEGCRSLSHLRNCETFTCPRDYIKCPERYCIPLMYMCNGRIDCPDGYDERACACKNKNMKVIVLIPGLSSEMTEISSKRLFETAIKLGGIMYSKGSVVKVLRYNHFNRMYIRIGRKRSLTKEFIIESNDILTNSEHKSLPDKTYELNSEDIENFFLDILGQENEENSTGIIWLSDEHAVSVGERIINSKLEILNGNITKYRVVIDRNVEKEISFTYGTFLKEIYVRNSDIIGTIGMQLFPEICEGKTFPCNEGYRCLLSKVCIPLKQVCDKQRQCPYGDDEHHCDFKCPENCSCHSLIMDCSNLYRENANLSIVAPPRVLSVVNSTNICHNILNSEITRKNLSLLINLNMSSCDIRYLDKSSFKSLQNLIVLDLSFNTFSILLDEVFFHLKSLQFIKLTGNRQLKEIEPGAFKSIKIKSLGITFTQVQTLSANTFVGLDLDELNLSNNMISSVQDYSFHSLTCASIDITGNPIETFTKAIFSGVQGVQSLRTPAYKFCCTRPSYLKEDDCLPHKDEFSSCEDLLRNSTIQALMWTIGVLALIGNVISLVYRLLYDKKRLKLGYGIFVTNLAVADLLMGIYMIMIAVADKIFRDRYIEVDDYWRNSNWCRLAGVLSTMSSEASVLFMCLITIDRILVIKYPFGQLRFKSKSAIVAVMICWLFVLLISLLPVLYSNYFQGRFYSKSAVCLALPLTRDRPPGWLYSILIFIGFNMFTFLLIALGQLLIYIEVRKQASLKKSLNMTRTNDLKVARNLLLVVTTDFLCWFPIGVMGVLALTGRTIPGEVYAWTAVIILPINSALNPFMYTLTAVFSRQKFNPSVEEQSRTNFDKEMGKSMLKIYPYMPTHKHKKNATLFCLADLMKDRHLTVHEIVVLIHRIVSFMVVLHNHELVTGNITENDVFVLISTSGKKMRKIQIDVGSYPELSSRKNDRANDLYHLGGLLNHILLKKAD